VGKSYSHKLIDFENADGSIKSISISNFLSLIFMEGFHRTLLPLNMIFPELLPYAICSQDRRLKRNADRLKVLVQGIIDDRRSNKTTSYDEDK